MQPLTAPDHPQTTNGRWIWLLSGTLTIAAIGAFGGFAIVRASNPPNGPLLMSAVPTRIVTVTQPVTALNVQSYGAPIKVTTAPGGPVRIAESITFDSGDGGPPTVTDTDSRGLLTLAAPACANSDCSVGFSVTVPAGVKVTTAASGGPVRIAESIMYDFGPGGRPADGH